MEYRNLGKSDLKISEIGFGCMSLPEDEASQEIVHRALDLGINFFDTADLYNKGMNEVMVGKALKEHRNNVILATKVGNQWRDDGSGWDWNPRKEYILMCIDKSLQRLQTDYIDLYQLHGGTIDDPIDDTIEAFELLKEQGKIRHYGISSIRPNVIREYIARSSIISVMMQYSLLDRRPEESCLELLLQNDIGVLARGSVAQGLLIDKPAKEYLQHTGEEVERAAEAVGKISASTRTPGQTSLKYVLHHAAVASAVVGIRTMKQLDEAAGTSLAPALSGEEYEQLQNSVRAKRYEQHR